MSRNPAIAVNWFHIKSSQPRVVFNRDSDVFGDVGDVLAVVAEAFGGAVVAGASGVAVIVGLTAADAAGLDEKIGIAGLPGIGVAARVLVVFGAAAIVPALVAGAAAGVAVELLVKSKPMNRSADRFRKTGVRKFLAHRQDQVDEPARNWESGPSRFRAWATSLW